MRPWYMDAEPAPYGATGFGALPAAYANAISQLQILANIVSPQPQSGLIPGEVAAIIDYVAQQVAQFSSGDVQTVQSNPAYQALLAQEQAVIANGDYTQSPPHATTTYYLSKGGYSFPAVGQAAAALMPVLQSLTGAMAPPAFNPTPNSTFTPVVTAGSARGLVRAVGPAPLTTSGSLLTPVPAGTVPPINAGLLPGSNPGPMYDPTTGVTTNNPGPPQPMDPNAPPTTGPSTATPAAGGAYVTPPSGMATVMTPNGPMTVPVHAGPVSSTDPSTGETTTTQTNPDGSVTVSTDGGPGGASNSVTYPPAPPTLVFLPRTREDAGRLIMALGLGAIGMGLLTLFVSSEEGEKVVTEVAKPIDAVVTPVTDAVTGAVDAVLPESGPAQNPVRRRRRARR